MFQKLIHFVKYNNAFTVLLLVFFFGFGLAFAASPDLRDNVYSTSETITSVDNNLILSTDLDTFNFNLKIDNVSDDAKNYYAVYSYQTLTIQDGAWKNDHIEKTLTVDKQALDGKDLGLYLAKELGENISYELSYLKRVQKLEQEKGESQKVVTVEYSGLIGKLFDPKDKVIEGYVPVVVESVSEVGAVIEAPSPEIDTPSIQSEPQQSVSPLPVVSAPPPIAPTIDPQVPVSVEATTTDSQLLPEITDETQGEDTISPSDQNNALHISAPATSSEATIEPAQ